MKIAVIGMGSIGQRHFRNLKTLGYSQVRGWDIDPAKGDPIDWDWKPDVALICTPPQTHYELAIDALCDGKVHGLFVEKPIGDKPAWEWPIALAKVTDVVTMVGCNWRFRSGMRDLLFRPGPLEMWAAIPIPIERRTLPIWDIGIHFLDLARWSGHIKYSLVAGYAGLYGVIINCGDKAKRWRKGSNAMYLSELRHFMHCVKTGEPTGNDFRQAAETLKLALEVRDG